MKLQTDLVFRLLEKAWAYADCTLIDLKIEFGITSKGLALIIIFF